MHSTLIRKLARLAAMQAEPAADEFGPTFFRRKLAEMTAEEENRRIMSAKPAGDNLPPIGKR